MLVTLDRCLFSVSSRIVHNAKANRMKFLRRPGKYFLISSLVTFVKLHLHLLRPSEDGSEAYDKNLAWKASIIEAHKMKGS